jgi:hypothetical protein
MTFWELGYVFLFICNEGEIPPQLVLLVVGTGLVVLLAVCGA